MVKVTGIEESIKNLTKYSHKFSENVLIDVTEDIYDNAKKNIAPHSKTGRMENNLSMRVQKRALTAQVYIEDSGIMAEWNGKGINYALFVHFGTKAHTIEPKNKKALRWASVGGFVFAKRVEHPGYKGDPFATNAARKTMLSIDKIYKKAYNDTL